MQNFKILTKEEISKLFDNHRKFIFACSFEGRIALMPVLVENQNSIFEKEININLPHTDEIFYMIKNNPLVTIEADKTCDNIINSLIFRGIVKYVNTANPYNIKITVRILSWEGRKFDLSD